MSSVATQEAAESLNRTGGKARTWIRRRSLLPLGLLIVMLVGSVVIPAALTWRVMSLLRENREIIEPARLLQSQLELGMAVEAAALREYTLTGSEAPRALYRSTARGDDRRLGELRRIGHRLGDETVTQIAVLERRIGEWRQLNGALLAQPGPSTESPGMSPDRETALDSASLAFTELAAHLRAEAVERQEQVRASEALSLLVNASLVLVAFAAMLWGTRLLGRERQLATDLERRIDAEIALRNAAETLAAAYTLADVTEAIARSALVATQARGVFVEQFVPGSGEAPDAVVVRASAGTGAPLPGSTTPYAGSYAEVVVRGGEPIVIPRLSCGTGVGRDSTTTDADCSAMVIPVGHAGAPIGALFVLGETGAHIRSDEMARARTFGHLAALAYEKVWLLNAARDRREELERVMKSRSGLMRGFTHDVKNPLGAADGYAELLTDNIYGQLSAQQKDIVERIRHSISRALGLIGQINTLARAETGRLELELEQVDLCELVRSAGEEYGAAAHNRGLALSVDLTGTLPIVETDPARVRQIIGNLMSNAIKYTEKGSVTIRARQHSPGPVDGKGSFVAIEVIDTGPGIPQEKQGQVFDEFVRLAGSDQPGTGLGLAISHRLAHALRGEITLESEPGRGSTFTLWLPSLEALASEHRQIQA